MKPGIYDGIPAEVYHNDLHAEDAPTLSRTIAKILCHESPLHAWTQHPKLNPDFAREHDDKFDLGTVCHEVLLNGQANIEVVYADDWRTNQAKADKAAARDAGRTPLLAKQWDQVQDVVIAARKQIGSHKADPPILRDGKPEATIVWEEPNGVTCRARLDWLRDDTSAIDDFKFTTRSANPESWSRTIFGLGYDLQADFYARGVERLTGYRPEFRLVVIETEPPHAMSVVSLGPDAAVIARKKVDYAVELWARCLERDEWPGFTDQVAWASLPGWEESSWLAKEEREAA